MADAALPPSLHLHALDGIPEIGPGDDLAALIAAAGELRDGDVVVVTSKAVSKAEGRLVDGDREDAITAETVRVVAARGPLRIVENRLGLVMAAAGVDNSNVAAGTVALLPEAPDTSARTLRRALHERRGVTVAVVITDTAGRAWRTGQTDLAIGVAGLAPSEAFAGRVDAYGNTLAVTEPAIADEIAGAAELVSGKLGGRPVVVVRGLAWRVLPLAEEGPGARALLRPRSEDLFNLGVREAVVAAVAGDDPEAFGPPAPADDLAAALRRCGLDARAGGGHLSVGTPDPGAEARCRVLARAHGWAVAATGPRATLTPTG